MRRTKKTSAQGLALLIIKKLSPGQSHAGALFERSANGLVLADHRPDASIRAISTSKAHHRGRRRRRLRAMIVIYISKKITDFRRRHRYHDRSMIVVPVAGVESLLIQCGRRFLVSNPWRRMINHGSRNPKCHNRLLDLVLARAQWLRRFANHHFPQSIGSRLF